jgi:uncharacterized coiled-coil protein SlyX
MNAAFALALIDAETMKNMAIGTVLLTATISTAAVLYPLARAMARRLEGKTRDDGSRAQLEDLTDRMHDLERQVGRMQELEERVDFAERLLTEAREPFAERKLIKGSKEAGADTPPEPVDVAR